MRPKKLQAKSGIIGILLVLLTLSTLPGSSPGAAANGNASMQQHVTDIPLRSRESPWNGLSDAMLWKRIQKAAASAPHEERSSRDIPPPEESTSQPMVSVGLKAPGQPRGVWRDTLLIDDSELARARASVLAHPGVTLVAADDILPVLTVRVTGPSVVVAIRRMPNVDYVEPAIFDLRLAQDPLGVGCSGKAVNTEFSARLHPGDVLPWNYAYHNIEAAWQRLLVRPGTGVTVAVLDTGVFREQSQLQMPEFAGGFSENRTVSNLGSNSWDGGDTPWGTCDHGTRIAGLVAAPRDAKNIVGIAWNANLVTVHSHGSVIIGDGNVDWIVRGMRKARMRGARIFTMAFGNIFWLNYLADEIRRQYYSTEPFGDVLLVGAAGTYFCPFGSTMFPSYMDEVLSVAGVGPDKHSIPWEGIGPISCSGDAVDVAAVIDRGTDTPDYRRGTETTGRTGDQVLDLGGASGATATIAGILALIWSEHPHLGRDQVRTRLLESGLGYHDPEIGRGVPDAYQAVGGYSSLRIDGPSYAEAGQTYSLRARPTGDGPFAYLWSTGATTPSISRTMTDTAEAQSTRVTVTDLRENKTLSTARTVRRGEPPDPCDRGIQDRPPC